MEKHPKLLALLLLTLITSCTRFIKMVEDDAYYEKIDTKGNTHFSIAFSNNIHGETHSCGCRQFPLGGIPQAAGLIGQLKLNSYALYIDSGDTFFPSTTFPKVFDQSLKHTAKTIAKSLDMMNLNYFTPGDQDFAAGIDFLAEISRESKFIFLISNLKKHTNIKHKRWAKIKIGEKTIFLIGTISPQLVPDGYKILDPVVPTIGKMIERIKDSGYQENSSEHILILVSHAGLDQDKLIARKYPVLDWIIGAHSQSFLQSESTVGNTKIAQGLSRNHYIGEIRIPLAKLSTSHKYRMIEVNNGLENKISPNPLISFIDKYKSKIKKIKLHEEKLMEQNSGE